MELIRDQPGFKTLMEKALAPEKEKLDKVTKNISESIFGGREVPDDLKRFWRAALFNEYNEHSGRSPFAKLYQDRCIQELLDDADSADQGACYQLAWSMLLRVVDIVAKTKQGHLIGYYRGHSREIAPSDSLVVGFRLCDEHGGKHTVAASLSKLLAYHADSDAQQDLLRRVFNDINLHDIPFAMKVIRNEVLSSKTLSDQEAEFSRLVAPLMNSATYPKGWEQRSTEVYFPSKVNLPWNT